jgi:hypothetical protein
VAEHRLRLEQELASLSCVATGRRVFLRPRILLLLVQLDVAAVTHLFQLHDATVIYRDFVGSLHIAYKVPVFLKPIGRVSGR